MYRYKAASLVIASVVLLGGCSNISLETEARFKEQHSEIRRAMVAAETAQKMAELALEEARFARMAAYDADDRATRILERAAER